MLPLYFVTVKQSGAAEACWALSPVVDGSKPSSAIFRPFQSFSRKLNSIQNQEFCAAVRVDYPTRIAHFRSCDGNLKMFPTKDNNAQRARVQMLTRYCIIFKQSGATEACWAHNREVDGSKPSSAIIRTIQ